MEDQTEKPADLARVVVDDEKPKAILKAAFEAFSRYGFQRTSMQDIAAGAGMSRAALYLHFRNKEDIFRSLAQYYFDDAVMQVESVLTLGLPVGDALHRAFEAMGGQIMDVLLTSPHGAELMDAKSRVTADINTAGEARLAAVYANWLRREAAAGRVVLGAAGPECTAEVLMAALHGLKNGDPTLETYRRRVAALANMMGRALAP